MYDKITVSKKGKKWDVSSPIPKKLIKIIEDLKIDSIECYSKRAQWFFIHNNKKYFYKMKEEEWISWITYITPLIKK